MSTITFTEPKRTTTSFLCPLCCEEDLSAPASSDVTLSSCGHRSCKACLVKWIEKEEASGQTTPPTCPFCRLAISESDVLAVLERPFRPRKALATEPNNEEEIDDLTLHWLDEQTVLCQGCGSRVEKVGGCDAMECLCGYRFCYNCGSPGGRCNCIRGNGVLNDHDGSNVNATVRDVYGRVDLRSTILRRRVRQERERRERRRLAEEVDRWDCSDELAGVCTANGRWLFSSTDEKRCTGMLAEQLSHGDVRGQRASRNKNEPHPHTSIDLSWLFLKGQGAEARALKQLFAKDKVQLERRVQRKESAKEVHHSYVYPGRDLDIIWLFLPNTSGFRVLAGVENAVRKRLGRARQLVNEDSEIDDVLGRGQWLFKKRPTESLQFLVYLYEQLSGAEKKRRTRDNARKEDKDEGVPGIEKLIKNGSWLFEKLTRAKSIDRLNRLYKQAKNARAAMMEKFLENLFSGGCGDPNCRNCGGGVEGKKKREAEEEERNLENILLIFPRQGEY